MYAEALNENERLKSRLQDSKQELAKIRSQLEKVTQVHGTETNPKHRSPDWKVTYQNHYLELPP